MTDHRLLAALEALPLEMERVRSELMASMQQFQGTVPLEGSRARQADSKLLATGSGRLVGWSVTPKGGTALVAVLRNGRDTSGDVLGVIACAPGATSTETLAGDVGVSFTEGLFLDVIAGTVIGSPADSITGAIHIGAVG